VAALVAVVAAEAFAQLEVVLVDREGHVAASVVFVAEAEGLAWVDVVDILDLVVVDVVVATVDSVESAIRLHLELLLLASPIFHRLGVGPMIQEDLRVIKAVVAVAAAAVDEEVLVEPLDQASVVHPRLKVEVL
jgi:hypothetical protein